MRTHTARWLGEHRSAILAACVILAASAIRIGLIAQGWPGTDSDDATMGLMAKHILTHGELPIFFYGQSYMGSIEAYIGALMFVVLGVSSFALKCGLVLLYATFLAVMYHLLSQAFSRGWALAGLVLLSLGDDDMLYHQLEAYGGYLETLLFGALMIVLATWLIRTSAATAHHTRHRRAWGYLALGLAAGLGIWSDPLVAPFVALSALFLLLTCWCELRRRMAILALAGLLIGISPWIVYIVTSPSLTAATSFLQRGTLPQTQHPIATSTPHPISTPQVTPPTHPASTAAAPPSSPTLGEIALDHLRGTVFIAVANNAGATALCPLSLNDAWPPSRWTSSRIQQCIAVRGIWGAAFLALMALAIGVESHTFLVLHRLKRDTSIATDRAAIARSAARLTAMGAPAATILLFSLGSVSSFAPYQYSRYLISIAIALPVVFATLWDHAATLPIHHRLALRSLRPRHTSRLPCSPPPASSSSRLPLAPWPPMARLPPPRHMRGNRRRWFTGSSSTTTPAFTPTIGPASAPSFKAMSRSYVVSSAPNSSQNPTAIRPMMQS